MIHLCEMLIFHKSGFFRVTFFLWESEPKAVFEIHANQRTIYDKR